MSKIKYSIIGGGWRAEFYLRIAALMPDIFYVPCILIRNKERAKAIAKNYSVKTSDSIDDLKKFSCDFIVNCINKDNISELSFALAADGFSVLSETPAYTNEAQLKKLLMMFNPEYKLQIAEQFHLKPTYQAIKKVIESGVIGEINNIYISVAHDYHAASLIRYLLNSDKAELLFQTESNLPIFHTNFRYGEVSPKTFQLSTRVIKIFDVNGKTVIYDFDKEQYFSPIRTDNLVIRGTRGEINNKTVRYFNENDEFVESKITQHHSGNLDGLYNSHISFENKVLYTSPFGTARLSDEETAIATVLLKMKDYLKTGKEFYSFIDAVKDVMLYTGDSKA